MAGKPASILVGFESSFHPFVRHAAYQAIADLPLDERLAALRTAEVRDAILAEDVQPAGPEAFLFANFHKLFPLGDPPNYEPAPEDSIGAIAEREGRTPLEVAYDLMLQRDGHELLYLPILGYANGGLWAIDEMLRHPATVLGLGDGGAHCGVLCDASLPTFMLTHWARDRSRGDTIPLEQVVAAPDQPHRRPLRVHRSRHGRPRLPRRPQRHRLRGPRARRTGDGLRPAGRRQAADPAGARATAPP